MTDEEIFFEWVKTRGYNNLEPINDPEYQKSLMNTISFSLYRLRFRLKEIYDKTFNKN